MMSDQRRPIPVNLIAGPLGVGKTTAINYLLQQRPADERWAVLINEYGQIGIDGALVEDKMQRHRVEVKEVAGGCICCSAGFIFQVSLVLLLQRRPDRLLIEPTGLATLSGILDTLARPGIRDAVDVRSIISLIDPARLDLDEVSIETKDQIEAADILLANRSDLASSAQLEAFDTWAGGFFPPKRLIGRIERGRVLLPMLDMVTDRPEAVGRVSDAHEAHSHGTKDAGDHSPADPELAELGPLRPVVRRHYDTSVASTTGWSIWAKRVFDDERLTQWLDEITRRPGLRRLKAVLHTSNGWRSFNIAEGAQESKASAYRRDSRLELIWTGPSRPTPTHLEAGLLSCLTEEGS